MVYDSLPPAFMQLLYLIILKNIEEPSVRVSLIGILEESLKQTAICKQTLVCLYWSRETHIDLHVCS